MDSFYRETLPNVELKQVLENLRDMACSEILSGKQCEFEEKDYKCLEDVFSSSLSGKEVLEIWKFACRSTAKNLGIEIRVEEPVAVADKLEEEVNRKKLLDIVKETLDLLAKSRICQELTKIQDLPERLFAIVEEDLDLNMPFFLGQIAIRSDEGIVQDMLLNFKALEEVPHDKRRKICKKIMKRGLFRTLKKVKKHESLRSYLLLMCKRVEKALIIQAFRIVALPRFIEELCPSRGTEAPLREPEICVDWTSC